MPFYEYRCEHCGHELEVLQKISDAPLVDCPECARPALKKLVSAAGFRLKGGGWYETDFKGGKKRNLHESGEKKEGGEKKKDANSPKDTKQEKSGIEKKPAAKPKTPATGD
ncbi:MAG: zinc ribbon domain-containing protein [Candidatus Thiosymbion ectosymbiont of Robbea hypermnestra]|nr:zinc ribbon domain-containing protein [Candidatus Thiosymbion ectosymbiont of Robbea hypermnestra]